jgi:hypothetical protein
LLLFYQGKSKEERKKKQLKSLIDEKTLNRELSSLRTIKDSHPKYLLSLDFDNSIIDGIKKTNVIDWLLK